MMGIRGMCDSEWNRRGRESAKEGDIFGTKEAL